MGIVSDGWRNKAFMPGKTLKTLAGKNLCTHFMTQVKSYSLFNKGSALSIDPKDA